MRYTLALKRHQIRNMSATMNLASSWELFFFEINGHAVDIMTTVSHLIDHDICL